MKEAKMKKPIIILLIVLVIIVILIVVMLTPIKRVCGPKGAGWGHSLDYCDKSCNIDEDCKFICGCGAININEECDKGNMEIKCLANFLVKCKNKECVVGET